MQQTEMTNYMNMDIEMSFEEREEEEEVELEAFKQRELEEYTQDY